MNDPSKVDKTTKVNMHPLVTDVNLDKHDIGLSQVDNLSLVNSIGQMNSNVDVINSSIDALTYALQQKVDKSVAINGQTIGNNTNIVVGMSSTIQNDFNTKEDKANKNISNGYAGLDPSGRLPQSIFPLNSNMLTYKGVWDADANVPTLSDASVETQGNWYLVSYAGTTQLNNINEWNVNDWIMSNGSAWLRISNTDRVTSVNGEIGNVVLSKVDLGLENVDNTGDLIKPVSTAMQTALDLKQDLADRDQSNGYAGLDANALIDNSHLKLGLSDLNIGKILETLCIKLSYDDINIVQLTQVSNITNPGSPTTYSELPTTYLMWLNSSNLNNLYMPDPSLYAYGTMIYARVGYDYQSSYYITIHGAINNSSVQISNGNMGLFYTDSLKWYFLTQLDQSIFFNMIKAVPETRQINGNSLTSDILLDKYSIGLQNVDNTSDADKPVSNATQTVLDSKQDTLVSQLNMKSLNTDSLLGSGDMQLDQTSLNLGYIIEMLCAKLQFSDLQTITYTQVSSITNIGSPTTYSVVPSTIVTWWDGNFVYDFWLPDPSIYTYGTIFYAVVVSSFQTTVHGASNIPSVNITTNRIGLFYTDTTKWYHLGNIPQSALLNVAKAVPTTTTINAHPLTSNVNLTKTDIGLSNVDNTSDTNKPISSATQTALALKQDTSAKNQPNGYAGLDATGNISQTQLGNVTLHSLSDVVISNAQTNQVLSYDGTQWINTTSSSGGGGGLTSNDIVAGTGDGTSTIPNTVLRGAQAAGTNVTPGDIIIRAPGGTGLMGSGSIRFQVATPSRSTYLLPFHAYTDLYTAVNNTFTSSTSMTLYNTGKVANVLAIAMCTSNVTITSFTIGGVAHTPLYSQQVGSGRFIASAFMNVPAADATGTCTVSSSTRIIVNYYYFDPNDWDGTITTGQSSTPTTTTASVSFTNLLKGDLIFNCFGNTVININNGQGAMTIPGEKSIYTIQNGGNPTAVVMQHYATRVLQDQASYTMTSTYTTLVNNIGLVAFYLRFASNTSTTIPTFTDALILSPFGQLSHILDSCYFLPTVNTNLLNIPFYRLTAQSSRFQSFHLTPYPNGGTRTIILPDPRTLNIGCKFYMNLPPGSQYQSSLGIYYSCAVYVIVPSSFGITPGLLGSNSSYLGGVIIGTNSGNPNPTTTELKAYDGYKSVWEYTTKDGVNNALQLTTTIVS